MFIEKETWSKMTDNDKIDLITSCINKGTKQFVFEDDGTITVAGTVRGYVLTPEDFANLGKKKPTHLPTAHLTIDQIMRCDFVDEDQGINFDNWDRLMAKGETDPEDAVMQSLWLTEKERI